jgi:hypothetical protein
MVMCPCSPDVGDCPRCKRSNQVLQESTLRKHPKKYTLKTRRRTQFLQKNIRRKTSRRK